MKRLTHIRPLVWACIGYYRQCLSCVYCFTLDPLDLHALLHVYIKHTSTGTHLRANRAYCTHTVNPTWNIVYCGWQSSELWSALLTSPLFSVIGLISCREAWVSPVNGDRGLSGRPLRLFYYLKKPSVAVSPRQWLLLKVGSVNM